LKEESEVLERRKKKKGRIRKKEEKMNALARRVGEGKKPNRRGKGGKSEIRGMWRKAG